jgi:hypothetical protein
MSVVAIAFAGAAVMLVVLFRVVKQWVITVPHGTVAFTTFFGKAHRVLKPGLHLLPLGERTIAVRLPSKGRTQNETVWTYETSVPTVSRQLDPPPASARTTDGVEIGIDGTIWWRVKVNNHGADHDLLSDFLQLGEDPMAALYERYRQVVMDVIRPLKVAELRSATLQSLAEKIKAGLVSDGPIDVLQVCVQDVIYPAEISASYAKSALARHVADAETASLESRIAQERARQENAKVQQETETQHMKHTETMRVEQELLRAKAAIEAQRLQELAIAERAKIKASSDAEVEDIKTRTDAARVRSLAAAEAEGIALKRRAELDGMVALCTEAAKHNVAMTDVAALVKARSKAIPYERIDQSKASVFISHGNKRAPAAAVADQLSVMASTAIAGQLHGAAHGRQNYE